jgi:hypothetical protein
MKTMQGSGNPTPSNSDEDPLLCVLTEDSGEPGFYFYAGVTSGTHCFLTREVSDKANKSRKLP